MSTSQLDLSPLARVYAYILSWTDEPIEEKTVTDPRRQAEESITATNQLTTEVESRPGDSSIARPAGQNKGGRRDEPEP